MIPTSQWETGQIWRDLYHVYVDEHAAAPSRLQVSVGLYDPRGERPLAAVGPDGAVMSMVLIGEARLAAPRSPAPTPPVPLRVPLAEGIVFSGHGHDPHPALPGATLNVTLYWQATDTPSRDYTVFVHLLGPDGVQVAGADGPPVEDFYPTSLWRSGDRVEDQHVMSLPGDMPAGTYRIAIGLYDPTTGQRLARLDGRGDSIEWPIQVGADPGP
jgi:hypothetical protein